MIVEDLSTLLILFSLFLLGNLALFYWKRRHFYITAAKYPGPPCWPIFGNALEAIGLNTNDILDRVMYFADTYRPVCRLWIGPILSISIRRPEDVKIVLTSPHALNKSVLYRVLEPLGGKGLVTAEASIWRRHRKILQPTFNQKILNYFLPILNMRSDILVDEALISRAGKEAFDIFDYFSRYTLDTTCETLMGTKINSQYGENEYIDSLAKIFEISFLRMAKVWLLPDLIFWRTNLGKITKQALCVMNSLTKRIIAEKRLELASSSNISTRLDKIDATLEQKKLVLDYMITYYQDGKCFTDQEILDEVNTLVAAGNDTSATSLSFTSVMLGMFPEVQERVYQELIDIFGDEKRPITSEDLARMKYLERVIKETMRMYPVIPLILRKASKDIDLGDHTIPNGATIICPIISIHRDPELYPNPMKFDPDRFLPEEIAKRHNYAYIPFSGGPRNCIGLAFAMMGVKTALTKILLKYTISTPFQTVDDFKTNGSMVLKSANGYLICLEKRITTVKTQQAYMKRI